MTYDTEINYFFSVLEGFAKRPCPDDEKKIWNNILRSVTFPKKQTLIEVGDIPEEFYFITLKT